MTDNMEKFAAGTNYEIIDEDGDRMCDVVETKESLDDWESSSVDWAQRSATHKGEVSGLPFLAWETTQTEKGQPRQSMSVVDLGDYRLALPGTNLDMF